MAQPATSSVAGLAALVGTWATEASHPAMPGTVVKGTSTAEWLEGEKFVILRSKTDHPDFPDSISIVGDTSEDRVEPGGRAVDTPHGLRMFYFDDRGVHRVYETRISPTAWEIWRIAAGFSQRFTGTFGDGGNTIDGLWHLSRDGKTWDDDLRITFRRRG